MHLVFLFFKGPQKYVPDRDDSLLFLGNLLSAVVESVWNMLPWAKIHRGTSCVEEIPSEERYQWNNAHSVPLLRNHVTAT